MGSPVSPTDKRQKIFYEHLRTISGKGGGENQFRERLFSIAVDGSGELYAVGDKEVKVFDLSGKLLRRWETGKPGVSVAVDEGGTVWVGQADQVEQFDKKGRRKGAWKDPKRLNLVTSIGFYKEYVLVGDVNDRGIRRYDRQGKWLNDIGKDNNTKGFMLPNGHLDFVVDGEGIIYAINSARHRVEKFTMDGKRVGRFGRFGNRRSEDFTGCCNPTNIALSGDGRILLTTKAPPGIKVFNTKGEFLGLIEWNGFDPNCKNMDVAADGEGRVFVVDTVKSDIQVFIAEPDLGIDSLEVSPAGSKEVKP